MNRLEYLTQLRRLLEDGGKKLLLQLVARKSPATAARMD